MIFAALFLCALPTSAAAVTGTSAQAVVAAPVAVGEPQIEWKAPDLYIAGLPYEVSVSVTAPQDGAPVAGWMLTASAFTVNGKPLAERKGTDIMQIAGGAHLELSFDLAPAIVSSGLVEGEGFELAYAKENIESPAVAVEVLPPAPTDLDFMEMPLEQLDDYWVVMDTTQGVMVAEMWPDVAPKHSRNFLDLAYTKFYDGLTFHRVMRGFMIQGGDPDGTGAGSGPRHIKAEFSQKRHVRGVLSAARLGHDIDSATSQFFVMHATNPGLDGKYSAFGKLVKGDDTLERIATTRVKRNQSGDLSMPVETQFTKRMVVVMAPAKDTEKADDKPADSGTNLKKKQ